MELILIRHARPERMVVHDGVADPGLTELGWEQARRMADWLAAEDIHHIAVSPKRRARETAMPLADALGIEPEVIHGLAEIDKSSKAYIPVEELRQEHNREILEKMQSRDWASLGYQDPDEFRKEVVAAKDDLLARHADKRIALVAHGGTINAIVSDMLALAEVFFFHPEYTSITRIARSWYGDRWAIHSLNELAHLHTRPNLRDPLPG